MILDFLKKYWAIIYSILGADLLGIIIVTKIYLHKSIKLHLGLFAFMLAVMMIIRVIFNKFIDKKIPKVSIRVEGNMLIVLAGALYSSIKFFANPTENVDFGSAPFFLLPYIFWCIFYARKYNICGCWFKTGEKNL